MAVLYKVEVDEGVIREAYYIDIDIWTKSLEKSGLHTQLGGGGTILYKVVVNEGVEPSCMNIDICIKHLTKSRNIYTQRRGGGSVP